MEQKKTFTGTGWSFPPNFQSKTAQVEMVSDRLDIEQSLRILLGTVKGERIIHTSYGCNLDEMIFESFNLTTKNYLTELIKTSILYYESRIDLLNLTIDETFLYEGKLLIALEYLVRATNSRFNMVYPFYLEEGTETAITKKIE